MDLLPFSPLLLFCLNLKKILTDSIFSLLLGRECSRTHQSRNGTTDRPAKDLHTRFRLLGRNDTTQTYEDNNIIVPLFLIDGLIIRMFE